MMKKVFLSALVACGFTICTHAQSHVVKLNPLGALFGQITAGYEHGLNETSSFQINLGIISKTISQSALGLGYEQKWSGFGITPEFRYYITNASQDVPRGAYVGPYAQALFMTNKLSFESENEAFANSETKYKNFGGGVEVGYQWLFNDVFSLDVNLGVGYQNTSSSSSTDDDENTFDIDFGLARSGVGLKGALSVGFAF